MFNVQHKYIMIVKKEVIKKQEIVITQSQVSFLFFSKNRKYKQLSNIILIENKPKMKNREREIKTKNGNIIKSTHSKLKNKHLFNNFTSQNKNKFLKTTFF